MTRNRETVDIEILIEDMTGIPDGWSSIEAFIKGGEGYPAYDITNNEVIGKIGKAIIEDGVVKGVIAKIWDFLLFSGLHIFISHRAKQ